MFCVVRCWGTLRHADGWQRAIVVGCTLLVGLLLLLLLLLDILGMMALVADTARQLIDTQRVVDVMRVGADWLMVSNGRYHHREWHAHGHRRTFVFRNVWSERRGRRQTGLRQHPGAGQTGQSAQATGTRHGVSFFVVRVAHTAIGLVVVRLVARVTATLNVPYATFFTSKKKKIALY